jgi:hypothetical protein
LLQSAASLCDNVKIRIIVTPVNDPPVANTDNYSTTEDVTLVVPAGTGVRVNDNDNADANALTMRAVVIFNWERRSRP